MSLRLATPRLTAPRCSVDYAFQRIGGKYKGRLIAYLAQGPVRYGQLRRYLPDVTPKMLTQALRELEADQLVTRHAYPEIPPRVEYTLTLAGTELLPFIALLKQWGERQMQLQGIPPLPHANLLTGAADPTDH